MAATGGHLSSSFSVLGDEIRAQRLSVKTPDFTRECCEQKRSRRDSDLYINEGWDRPKTGRSHDLPPPPRKKLFFFNMFVRKLKILTPPPSHPPKQYLFSYTNTDVQF